VASIQDAYIGLAVETTPKTFVAPTDFPEFSEMTVDWTPTRVQGDGIRSGSRLARADRNVTVSGQGAGDVAFPAISKGMSKWLRCAMGTAVSTLVSGSTYQQLYTLGDSPSTLTIQGCYPRADGTIDTYSFTGCLLNGFEFTYDNQAIGKFKFPVDAADLSVVQTAATYAPLASASLYHWANLTITTGTLTAPTTTALASSITNTLNIRSGSIILNRNLSTDRFNAGGAGRKTKQLAGTPEITGTLEIEYDSITYRDLLLNDLTMPLIVQYVTTTALSTGFETLQVVLPAIKIMPGALAKPNGTELIIQSVPFTALESPLGGQGAYVVLRTSEAAI
jgi:hypothetical protein